MTLIALVETVVIAAALLCSLVAGLLFAFAVVVMPGISRLDDASFIRAFAAIDRVIQNNQPLFMLVWVGSVLAVIAAAALGWWTAAGVDRLLLVFAAVVYLLGVQMPTGMINIPLNNRLQRLDLATMTDAARRHARQSFERRWNRWNVIRTIAAIAVVVLLLVVLLGL